MSLSSNIRKHSPELIKPTENGAKGILGYLPEITGVQRTGFFTGVDFLGQDLNLTPDANAEIFTLKIWNGTATIPSAARVAQLEQVQNTYLTKAEYTQIELAQKAAFDAALAAVDLKDLDVTEWMAAMANLVTKTELQVFGDLLNVTIQKLDTTIQKVATLEIQVASRISAIKDYDGLVLGDMLKNVNGLNYFAFPQPANTKLVRSRVSCDGIPVPRNQYTTLSEGIVKFVNPDPNFGTIYEVECFYTGDFPTAGN
jgi:hypothetical protein